MLPPLHLFLLIVQGIQGEHSGKPGKYSKHNVTHKYQRNLTMTLKHNRLIFLTLLFWKSGSIILNLCWTRNISGPERGSNGGMEKNTEWEAYSSPNIKIKKSRWVGHVVCTRKMRNTCKISVGKADKRDHLGDLGIDRIILKWNLWKQVWGYELDSTG